MDGEANGQMRQGCLRHPFFVFLHDLAMVPLAWFGAYWLRFNLGEIPSEFMGTAWRWLPLVVGIQLSAFVYFGLYRGHWRFASIPDLLRILKAVVLGTLAVVVVLFLFTRLQGIPRSVFPLYAVLLTGLLCGPRLFYRWFKDRRLYIGQGKRVLIVGAGRAGEMLARDLLRDPHRSLDPVGFVDDDTLKQGREVHGIRVLGNGAQLPALVVEHNIDLVLLAVPSARSAQIRRLVEQCEVAGVPFRMLPRMVDLMAGQAKVAALREVSIEDLLGRDPVSLDWQTIGKGLSGKSVLVSGGGGSIGSELCRQIAHLGPAELVVFENNEYNLYHIERELRVKYPWLNLHGYLGDVRDRASVVKAFESYNPEVVFHAAAYKHVPMLEERSREAVRNNVLGSRLMAEMADRFGCATFVMISTDKAVNPANVMGATKRIAEIYCQALNKRSQTRYITVRFGNVLGSAGSVVPLFQKQIKKGGPVTVTHPEITRYFMTIPEASQLIMQAAVMGEGGEIFVLDMGEPIKIAYLAEQMIRLSGKTPGEDIQIVYTGLRPGEKLYEELFYQHEGHLPTQHDKILLARSCESDWETLTASLRAMEEAVENYDETRLLELLDALVPELAVQQGRVSDNVIPLPRLPLPA